MQPKLTRQGSSVNIRSFKLYLHLCDSLNFSHTAAQMHLSPSTLSRAIQRLEEEVGCRLLERDNRCLALTQAGKEFKQFAQQSLHQWQALQNRLSPDKHLVGKLNLYCTVTAAYSHLPPLLDKFRQQQPLVEINLITGDAAHAVNYIQQAKADIAIAARPELLPTNLHFSMIDSVPLQLSIPQIPCLSQQLAQQKNIGWEQLPFILPELGPVRQRCDTWFKQMQLKPKIYAQATGHEAITSMVALGLGISILPTAVLTHSPVKDRIGTLVSPVPIAPLLLGCCCKKQKKDDNIIAAFLQLIDEN